MLYVQLCQGQKDTPFLPVREIKLRTLAVLWAQVHLHPHHQLILQDAKRLLRKQSMSRTLRLRLFKAVKEV